ncbi:conserved phage C-terminal domain-containing protein [Bacillus sp. A301a_S52]|nr:conserved phage C-terminal domain-containing protein [Bacillus sp. A301a_S52]
MLHRSYQAFADQFGLSKRQAKQACDFLEEQGLIRREFRNVVTKGQSNANVMFIEPCPKKVSEFTFTHMGTTERTTILHSNVPPSYNGMYDPPTFECKTYTSITTEITKDIIAYLNEKAAKRFKPTSQKTKKLIQARLNEKFELDDFKQVIDNKVASWKNDSKMNAFLRPETLFGTKFESYLNETPNSTQTEDLYAFADELEEEDNDES